MFRSHSIAIVAVLILALAQTSCMVKSDHPLSDPAKAKADERLFGQWKRTNKDLEIEHWFFGRPRACDIAKAPKGLMVVYGTSVSAEHEIFANGEPDYFFCD